MQVLLNRSRVVEPSVFFLRKGISYVWIFGFFDLERLLLRDFVGSRFCELAAIGISNIEINSFLCFFPSFLFSSALSMFPLFLFFFWTQLVFVQLNGARRLVLFFLLFFFGVWRARWARWFACLGISSFLTNFWRWKALVCTCTGHYKVRRHVHEWWRMFVQVLFGRDLGARRRI